MDDLALVTNEVKIAIASNALLFLVLAIYYKVRPPKKINHFYGYRTRRSMANEDVWNVANTYSSAIFFKLSILLVITGIIFIFFEVPYGLIIHIGILLIGIGVTVYATETYLNTVFNKNGKRRG